MADSKISGLSAATTPLAGTEEAAVVQSGSTVRVAVSEFGAATLATGDQTIDTNNRVIKIGGTLSTDTLEIEDSAGSDAVHFRGDKSVRFFGSIGVNSNPAVGTAQVIMTGDGGVYGYFVSGSHSSGGFVCQGAGGTTPYQFFASKVLKTGFRAESQAAATALRCGFDSDFVHTNSLDNVCFRAEAINAGAGAAIALDTVDGDFRFGTGTGSIFGTATTEKIGFWATTPIVQPTALTAADATATDGTIGVNDTITNNLRTRLDELEARLSSAGGGIGLIA